MSESTGSIFHNSEADAEVELSADDLLALAPSPDVEQPHPSPMIEPSTLAATTSSFAIKALNAPARHHLHTSRLALSLVAATGIAVATYSLTPSSDLNRSAVNASRDGSQLERPTLEQTPKGEPVRFTNPFDKHEVFEFAPGTSETDAREAVAAALMERAIARQKT
jgi:hypothetical protein